MQNDLSKELHDMKDFLEAKEAQIYNSAALIKLILDSLILNNGDENIEACLSVCLNMIEGVKKELELYISKLISLTVTEGSHA